jgi:hypothetical protein
MRAYLIGICLAVCSACAAIGSAVVTAVDRGLRFMLSAVSPEPALALDGGNEGYVDHAFTFADPRVDRHEAGVSRRSAARHI